MSVSAEDYALQWAADVAVAEATRDRTLQTQQRILGVSDIGHCRSYAARFLNGDPFTDAGQSSAAVEGTAIHAYVLPLIATARGIDTYEVPLGLGTPVAVHPNVYLAAEVAFGRLLGPLNDFKTRSGWLAVTLRWP